MPRTCQHRDCDVTLREDAVDALLPSYLTRLACKRSRGGCGERYLLDAETGEVNA